MGEISFSPELPQAEFLNILLHPTPSPAIRLYPDDYGRIRIQKGV